MRILYIDDDVQMFLALNQVVRGRAELQWAPHSVYAKPLAKEIPYDLIIVDLIGTFDGDPLPQIDELPGRRVVITSGTAVPMDLAHEFVEKHVLLYWMNELLNSEKGSEDDTQTTTKEG